MILITFSSVAVGQIADFYFFNYANTEPSVIRRENIVECRVYDSSIERDSTNKALKYIKKYNSNGFQTSELEYWNGDTTDIDEQYYKYDSANRVVESTYIMNQPYDATKTTYEYDELGNLILTCDYSTISPKVEFELDSCITLEYNKKGILSKTSSTNGIISTFKLKKGTLLEYSAEGLLETRFENGQPTEKIKEDGFAHYLWNSDMNLIQITSLNLNLDTIRVSTYEYRNGLLISNKQTNYETGKSSEYLYEYITSR
ncbi:hypothetical protein [Marinoscillum luteum]|uniref:YD repeat-containing protein n=1 Tax=Marinoscillum luteum TaxID=861051 RepID=A0ABW7N822_9BACT